MKLGILLGLAALLLASAQAAPIQEDVETPAVSGGEVVDQAIIDEIMETLKKEGTEAAKKIVAELLQDAKGAMKDLLLKVMQQIIILELEGKLKNRDDSYILDLIGIDMDQIRAILRELAEHGKGAAIELAKKMLEHAKGALRNMIIKILEMLERSDDAFFLDLIGIDMDQIRAILRELAEHGKGAAIELAKKMLEHAKGALRNMIIKILEMLERSDDAYILDLIGIDMDQIRAILRELAEHGKGAAIELAKKMLEHAKGALRNMIIKILEMLERSDDAYFLDLIGIDMDQIRAILRELAEHGKEAAIKLGEKMLEEARGTLRDLLAKVIEWLKNSTY